MKIQLDTKNKTIKVEENVNLGEFITKVKLLLGKDYENFTLEIGAITYWYNPITWTPSYPYYENPYYYTGTIEVNNYATTTVDSTGDPTTSIVDAECIINFEIE